MNTAAPVEQNGKAKEPEFKPQTRLTTAFFVNAVAFGGESQSVTIGRNCDSIWPARLEQDGKAVTVEANQRADGILLRRKHHDLNTHARVVQQTFVPWSNIRSLQYSE